MALRIQDTQRLLNSMHHELLAAKAQHQRKQLALGAVQQQLSLQSTIRTDNTQQLPALSSQESRDFLTSILILHRQEEMRREKLRASTKTATAAANEKKQAVAHADCATCEDKEKTVERRRTLQQSNKKDSKWLLTLEELRAYKAKNGDCIVPRGFSENPRLASWVAEQRKQYKLLKDGKPSSITHDRIALLQELGFAWNAQEAAWCRHMHGLKKFRQENGHCHVPLHDPRYPKLGLWVKEQRRHYTLMKQGKQSHMTDERISQLDAIDFCWDTHEATWLERLRELADFKERFGSCIVPTSFHENPKLGTWVHHQRRQYKKFKEGKTCHITEERIRALETLGFIWYPRDKRSLSDDESSTGGNTSDSDLESLDFRPLKRLRRTQ